jgi:hypothetical protein
MADQFSIMEEFAPTEEASAGARKIRNDILKQPDMVGGKSGVNTDFRKTEDAAINRRLRIKQAGTKKEKEVLKKEEANYGEAQDADYLKAFQMIKRDGKDDTSNEVINAYLSILGKKPKPGKK